MLTFIQTKLKIVFFGMAIGLANIIPGLSGGTIAVVLGIYDRLIESISNFFTHKEKRKTYFFFLMQIGIGAVAGILLFAKLIEYSMIHFNQITMLFFMGLVLGCIPSVYKSHKDMTITVPRIFSFLIAMSIMVAFFFLDSGKPGTDSLVYLSPWFYLLSGMIAAGAMIIPGISGSMLLVLLGTYPSIVAAVTNANLHVLIPLAIGVGAGILVFAKVINVLLAKAPAATYFAILGLIFGSFLKLWPGAALDVSSLIGLVVFCAAFFLALKMNISESGS